MKKHMTCPLCRYGFLIYENSNVHMWVCDMCPFIGFEFYGRKDIENLSKRLKK